jgi:putative transposase
MAKGRPLEPIHLTTDTRSKLQAIAGARSLPHGLVRRAQIILMAAEGASNKTIAQWLKLSAPTISLWRRRFKRQGLVGLYDELRPGAPRSVTDEKIATLIAKTLETKPKDGTHWTCRSIAEATKLSKSTVQRVWQAFGIQPHRQKHFKLSTDSFFVEKVRDIVGLYLNPPDKALVLCVDEKSQIQALNRTQPLLPLGLGYVEGLTHDYIRHGTTTLFAALDLASARVLTQCKSRHRHQEFLQFLRHIDANVPKDLEIHLIVDNYATHKHAKIKAWIAARPRYHVHYTPTYASWLNQVEIWFNIITQRAIRRGTFRSVKELVHKINRFVDEYNKNSKPFSWTATADSILAKIERLCKAITGTRYQRQKSRVYIKKLEHLSIFFNWRLSFACRA